MVALEEVLARGLEEALELVEGQAEEGDTEVVEVLVVVVGLVEELDLVVAAAAAQLVAVH